jgi:hypothetical protein
MNAKMQTPLNPDVCLAAIKGFKGARRGGLRREAKYSHPRSRLPIFTVAREGRGHERR